MSLTDEAIDGEVVRLGEVGYERSVNRFLQTKLKPE